MAEEPGASSSQLLLRLERAACGFSRLCSARRAGSALALEQAAAGAPKAAPPLSSWERESGSFIACL